MVQRIWRIVVGEWREQRRQPALLVSILALFAAVGSLQLFIFVMLDHLAGVPQRLALLQSNLHVAGLGEGLTPEVISGAVVDAYTWLAFTQGLGFAGMLAGHAILQHRGRRDTPFAGLSPACSAELLAGKVLGVVAFPVAVSAAVNGLVGVLASGLAVMAPHADRLPPSVAWMVALLFTSPAWSFFVASLCAIFAGLARDLRMARLSVGVLVLASTICCSLLVNDISTEDVGAQALLALLGAAGGLAAIGLASRLPRR